MAERIYLDWNATTPPHPDVVVAMAEALRDGWANPSSVHGDGRRARLWVERAREAVAELAEADPRDVVLTGGGTEANNLAVRSAFQEAGVLVTSRLEHPSVTRVAEALEREGRATVRWLRVMEDGQIDLGDLERALAEGGVRLVAVQAVNHETGVLQPVEEVIALARKHKVRVHVDAVQAFGKVRELGLGADTRSLAAHKMRGPKGIGALVALPGVGLNPVLVGGSQERGLRPGTVDPVAAAGLAVAAAHARGAPERLAAVAPLRDALEAALLRKHGAERVGTGPRAPHVSCVTFAGWPGAELVAALDLEGVSASSGSACSAGTSDPSPGVAAIVGDARSRSALRLSIGETTTRDEVERAEGILVRVLGRTPSPVG